VYLDVPSGFSTQVAIIEEPLAGYLPTSNWLLLGDVSVRQIWHFHNMPEPEVSNWVETSEAAKRMETLLPWLEHWAKRNIHRNHTLVVVGGGILTDMGGLAASLYMRGMAWHVWPTSLLAQIDAGIGGKTAVNLDSGKNLAGAFYNPKRMVVANSFLDSLPPRHKESGKWELIKMALIEGDIAWAESLLDCKIPSSSDMKRAIELKIAIVNKDFKEHGERRLLNLGHTLGHAIESASNFDILHGEAIGLGTLAACLLSESCGFAAFPSGLIERTIKHLAPLSPRMPVWKKCLPFLWRDKKNEAENNLNFIIPIPGSHPIQQKILPQDLESAFTKLLFMLNSH